MEPINFVGIQGKIRCGIDTSIPENQKMASFPQESNEYGRIRVGASDLTSRTNMISHAPRRQPSHSEPGLISFWHDVVVRVGSNQILRWRRAMGRKKLFLISSSHKYPHLQLLPWGYQAYAHFRHSRQLALPTSFCHLDVVPGRETSIHFPT